jgi:hypothetical protein
MQRDPAAHVRRLAEFVGLPFSSGEEDGGVVDAVVALCSFERMKGMAATKGGRTELSFGVVPNSSFFRQGVVGDWVNHLSPEMARRIDGSRRLVIADQSSLSSSALLVRVVSLLLNNASACMLRVPRSQQHCCRLLYVASFYCTSCLCILLIARIKGFGCMFVRVQAF